MARRATENRSTVKGTCGHACDAWPQVSRGTLRFVVCDVCNDWVEIQKKPVQLSFDDVMEPGY